MKGVFKAASSADSMVTREWWSYIFVFIYFAVTFIIAVSSHQTYVEVLIREQYD